MSPGLKYAVVKDGFTYRTDVYQGAFDVFLGWCTGRSVVTLKVAKTGRIIHRFSDGKHVIYNGRRTGAA